VNVEMHKRLTDDSDRIRAWEKGIWAKAVPTETPHVFQMSPEDFYIFHFVHLHKDFMNGSLGLRRIVDTWLLYKQNNVNRKTVRDYLKQFGMLSFHDRMVKLAKATMGEIEIDRDSEILLNHAFTHGIYGTDKSYKAGRIAAMGGSLRRGKLRSFLSAVFLPYSRMKTQYPVVEKRPILLPWCWLKRILHFLRGNMNQNKKKLDYRNVNKADYEEMKRFFEAGGVRKNISCKNNKGEK